MNKQEKIEQLSTIVDGMDEVVYVRDYENYDLLYLNARGQELTGITDYEGKKCFDVLQKRTEPCEFCNRCVPECGKYMVREVDIPHHQKHFVLKEKMIVWGSKKATLTIGLDVTEKEIMSQKVQEKLDFEKNIVECTKMLVEEPDRNAAIDGLLRSIGKFYGSDRAYLFELQENELFWDNTHEWCQEGVTPQIENLQNVPIEITRRWMELFTIGESIVIEELDSIKEISPDEWAILKMQNIKNLIVSPIWKDLKVIGFIGVDNPKKHIHDCGQVQTIAVFLADRLIKDQTKQRLHEMFGFHNEDILNATRLGMWVIRLGKDGEANEMFADQTMREIMGIKGEISPQKCYEHWYGRIKEGYYHYVNYAVEDMVETGRTVELSYTWKHPVKGDVSVRCLGVRGDDSEGKICLKGYHREINEVFQPDFLPDEKSIIFEYDKKNHSIYFHNDRGKLVGELEKENHFPQCWVNAGIVHPHFVNKFQQFFANVDNGVETKREEILLKTKEGVFEWYRIRNHQLDDNLNDIFIIILDPANQERAIELEYLRQKDFYKAVLSETIAFAEIDMESKHVLQLGGIWSDYAEERKDKNYLEILTQYRNLVIHPDDVESYEKFLSEETFYQILGEGKDTAKIEFRRMIKDKMHWVEMTGHVFQEKFSENYYALIYMKDIDAEKKRELEQTIAATRDPLTKVLNRRAFEEEVTRHVLTSNGEYAGSLILVDMDDFKKINDRFGHAEGDAVLKQLAEMLKATFRSDDLIGRLGGDEFIVYLKNLTNKEIIDSRMKKLQDTIVNSEGHMTTCSVGISFVATKDFSYTACLEEADKALYDSKAKGKKIHSYYEG